MNKGAETDDDARIDSAPSQGLKKRTGLPLTRRAPLRVNLSLLPSAQELIGPTVPRPTAHRFKLARDQGLGDSRGVGGSWWRVLAAVTQALSESASIAPRAVEPGKKIVQSLKVSPAHSVPSRGGLSGPTSDRPPDTASGPAPAQRRQRPSAGTKSAASASAGPSPVTAEHAPLPNLLPVCAIQPAPAPEPPLPSSRSRPRPRPPQPPGSAGPSPTPVTATAPRRPKKKTAGRGLGPCCAPSQRKGCLPRRRQPAIRPSTAPGGVCVVCGGGGDGGGRSSGGGSMPAACAKHGG
jgi:hypothetical protein